MINFILDEVFKKFFLNYNRLDVDILPMNVVIVVALKCEAQPIIEVFKLTQSSNRQYFEIWHSDSILLIISGVGKIAAATAVGYASQIPSHPIDLWVNFGIAGHCDLPLGSTVIPTSVTDATSKRVFYPVLHRALPEHALPLCTVDQVETSYKDQAIFDMEGSGFCYATAKFASLERIALFKMISDNRENPSGTLQKKRIHQLISCYAMNKFQDWLASFPKLFQESPRNCLSIPLQLLQKLRITQCERQILEKKLEQIAIIDPEEGKRAFFEMHKARSKTGLFEILDHIFHSRLERIYEPSYSVFDCEDFLGR